MSLYKGQKQISGQYTVKYSDIYQHCISFACKGSGGNVVGHIHIMIYTKGESAMTATTFLEWLNSQGDVMSTGALKSAPAGSYDINICAVSKGDDISVYKIVLHENPEAYYTRFIDPATFVDTVTKL